MLSAQHQQWLHLQPPHIYIFESELQRNPFKWTSCTATAENLKNRPSKGVQIGLNAALMMQHPPSCSWLYHSGWMRHHRDKWCWAAHWNEVSRVEGKKGLKIHRCVFVWLWLTHSPRHSMKAEQNERRSEVMHVGVSWIQQCRKFSLNELETSQVLSKYFQ